MLISIRSQVLHQIVCWYVKCVERVPFRKSGHILWLPHRTCIKKFLIGHGYLCQSFEQKDFRILLVNQAVLQMSEISNHL